VNYRTSREILRCCQGIVSGTSFDDMDEGSDSLEGYRSEFSGPAPLSLRAYHSHVEELAGLAWTIKEWQADGIAPQDMCVVARTSQQREDAAKALHAAGFDTLVPGPAASPQDEDPGVRVMTMHRAKGLEFQAIAVVGADDGTIPPGWVIPTTTLTPATFCSKNAACCTWRARAPATGSPSAGPGNPVGSSRS
jgi:superfamily I DNA/RNA helicase